MKIGETVRLKKWRDYFGPGEYIEYGSKDRNRVGVFIFIGSEDIRDMKIQPDEVLKAMGWTPPKDVAK